MDSSNVQARRNNKQQAEHGVCTPMVGIGVIGEQAPLSLLDLFSILFPGTVNPFIRFSGPPPVEGW